MKTRITALLLVLVLAATLLCGCQYNYDKKDFGAYVEAYDAEAMKAALNAIEVEDEDFTTDEETRKQKVVEALEKTFRENYVGEALTTGKIGARDNVTVRYYLRMENAESKGTLLEQIYSLDTMESALTISFAVESGINKTIYDDLKAKDGSLTYGGSISVDGTVKAGDAVIVTYTKKTTEGESVTKNDESALITVPATDDGTLGGALLGKELGKALYTDTTKPLTVGNDAYLNVKPVCVCTGTQECKITLTKDTELTDAFGEKKTFKKDECGVAYVIVESRITVPDSTQDENREALLKTLLTEYDYTTKSPLSVFSNTDYQYKTGLKDPATFNMKDVFDTIIYQAGDKSTAATGTVATIIAMVDGLDAIKPLKDAYDTAKAAYEAASKDETVTDEEEASKKTASETAKTAYDEAVLAYNLEMVLKAEKVSADTEKDAQTVLYDAFYQEQYDTLEDAYNEAMATKIAEKVNDVLDGAIQVTGAPKAAVRRAYRTNLNYYRYMYYESTTEDSETGKTINQTYDTLEDYLQAQATSYVQGKDESAAAVTTKKDRKEALRAQAEDQVKEIIAVYTMVDAINEAYDTDIAYSKDAAIDFLENAKVVDMYSGLGWYVSYLYYYQAMYYQYYQNDSSVDVTSWTGETIYDLVEKDLGETALKVKVLNYEMQKVVYQVKEGGGDLDFVNIGWTPVKTAD